MAEPGEEAVLEGIEKELEGGAPEPKAPEPKGGEEDDDTFVSKAEKEGLKAVPYNRFASVYKKEKAAREHAKWRTENEPKLTTFQRQIDHLRTRIGTTPYLQEALIELLDSADGSFNQQKLLAGLQKALEGKPAADKPASPAALDPAKFKQELLEEFRQEQLVSSVQNKINNFLSIGLAKLVKTDPDFDGIVVDAEFQDEVETQLEKANKRGEANGDDIDAELLAAAKKAAARVRGFQSSVLQRQVAAGGRKAGAAAIRTTTASGGAKVKPPNPDTDPEGYEAWQEAKMKAIQAELNG